MAGVTIPTSPSAGNIGSLTGNPWRMLYTDALGAVQEIELGTNGQVLQSNGVNQVPSFEDAGGGGGGLPTTANVIFYNDGTGTLQTLTLGAAGEVLESQGPGAAPTWTNVASPNIEDLSSTQANALVYIDGSNNVQTLAYGSNGQVLESQGPSSTPAWATPTNPNADDLQATFSNAVIYADGSGNLLGVAFGGNGQVLTSTGATTAPSWSTPTLGSIGASDPWSVIYTDGSGAFQELPLGSTGQFLQSQGASSVPQFADVPSPDIGDISSATPDSVLYTNNAGTVVTLSLGAAGTVLQSAGPTTPPTWASPGLNDTQSKDTVALILALAG